MGITATTDDALLEKLIDRASDKIESYAGRPFLSRDYREWRNGRWNGEIVLKQRPVTAVKRVGYGRKDAFSVSASTSTDLRATVEVQDDRIILSRFASTGTETSTPLAFATYPTVTLLVAQINVTSGWSATVINDCICLDLHRLAGQDAKTTVFYATWPDQDSAAVIADEDQGIIQIRSEPWWPTEGDARFPRGTRNVLVQYTAGYATVPDDLEDVCINLVQMMFRSRNTNPMMEAESLGDYSYRLASAVNLDDRMRSELAFYREIR